MSQEDIDYKLMEFIDLSDEAVVNTFVGENAAVEYITEGEESFMRITSLTSSDYPYAFSTKYPKNVLGGQADYVVVKYRTSAPQDCEDLGIIYRNIYNEEYDLDNCYSEVIGTDGEWHTVIFYMDIEAAWLQHFVSNIGFAPFLYSDNSAQQSIDVAWMKFYQIDPLDFYLDSMYDPDATDDPEIPDEGETGEIVEDGTDAPVEDATDAPVEDGTEAPAEAKTEAETKTEAKTEAEAEAKTDAATKAEAKTDAEAATKAEADGSAADGTAADTTASDESGCASSVIAGVSLLSLCLGGAALVVRKKKED